VKIAVVGSGVSGLGAAWALSRTHEVTVFEAAQNLGGHANSVSIEDEGRQVLVDTGFIVYNERNYPNLVRLFEVLGVASEPSDMSFAVSIDRGAFEYGARLSGLLAQPSNLLSPSYLRMVREMVRFCREATALSSSSDDAAAAMTTGEFLAAGGYSDRFRDDFLLPMVACIWSSNLEAMLSYPAVTMASFLDNHGLLDIGDRPRWRTVTGGSRTYVERIASGLADVRTGDPVVRVDRIEDGVLIHAKSGEAGLFDHVVLATHADTSLAILGEDAVAAERDVLGSFRYQRNIAVLHRDPDLMPVRRRAWSSWNYVARRGSAADSAVCLTYWMNRLQNLRTRRPVFVTLNPSVEPADVEATFTYHHPAFDAASVRAQTRIPQIQGTRRTWFAGSYCGHGFHEDGLRAGLTVAAALGAPAPWWDAQAGPGGVPPRPSLVAAGSEARR
jgi:predicted NAD/FAD-binding protein